MAIAYTKKMMIERLRRHIANEFPDQEFSISQNEMLMYIDTALASSMIGNIYGMAKVEGVLVTPEAYLLRTELDALIKDEATGEWYADLPQTPVSLPLGYSITNAYFADSQNGLSQPIYPVRAQRWGYRSFLPKPSGCSYRVLGGRMFIKAKDNMPLSELTAYVEMLSTRTTDVNETMNVPDDILTAIFDKVAKDCMVRLQMPKDIIKDDIGAGNKSS